MTEVNHSLREEKKLQIVRSIESKVSTDLQNIKNFNFHNNYIIIYYNFLDFYYL
jgi:hypothetical protein